MTRGAVQGGVAASITIEGLHVGGPGLVPADATGDAWSTGSFKAPVDGPLRLGRTNLAGDGQADLVNHGGPDKAVCCYPAAHYPDWHGELGLAPAAFPYGAFGENLTLAGQTEATVSIGDTFTVGTATVQVSQPRQPCWKLSRRWGVRDLAARVQRTRRTGWYVRVIEEGEVAAGQALTLVARPLPEWTIARVTGVIYDAKDLAGAAALADCDLLAGSIRAYLAERIHDAKASAPT